MKQVQKAIIKDGDKFLMIYRWNNADAFPRMWDFPGGKLEPGEEKIQGIKREIKEEVNLDAEIGPVITEFELGVPKPEGLRPFHFTFYNIHSYSGEVKLSFEHTEFKWLTKEELLELNITPFVRKFFGEE